MSKDTVKNIFIGTAASIISGVFLYYFPTLRTYIANIFKWLISTATSLWDQLFISYSLPLWIWIIIFILALIGLINIYMANRGEKEVPKYYSYTEDNFYGAIWRWEWTGNKVYELWCYCPNCDATLVYDDSSSRSLYDDSKTNFICENCNHSIKATIPGGNKSYALSAIKREIDRRIRTNTYTTV